MLIFIHRRLISPLCTLLTKKHKTGADIRTAAPRRFLFLKCIEQGALIASLPALRYLKSTVDEKNVFIAALASVADLFSAVDIIDSRRLFVIDDRSGLSLLRELPRLRHWIVANGIDCVIDGEGLSLSSALLLRLLPAVAKVGFVHPRVPGRGAAALTHPVEFTDEHISRQFMRLVLVAAGQPAELPAELYLPRLNIATQPVSLPAESRHRPLVLINPNENDFLLVRKWPLDFYRILIERLLRETDAFIALIGTASERDTAGRLQTSLPPDLHTRLHSCIGTTTFRQLCGLLQNARLLISSDSGPAHFAALFNTPSVVLFGPESPERYAPLNPRAVCLRSSRSCAPCLSPFEDRLCRCKNNQCLRDISVDTVFEAALSLLNRRL